MLYLFYNKSISFILSFYNKISKKPMQYFSYKAGKEYTYYILDIVHFPKLGDPRIHTYMFPWGLTF